MILLLTACAEDATAVKVFGEVFAAPPTDAALAPNATLVTYEEDGTTEFDRVIADDKAVFALSVPAGQTFVLTATGGDGKTSSFASVAPLYDFYAGNGFPWVASQSWLDTVAETWAGCPTGEGAMVLGEVRAPVGSNDEIELWPLVPEAEIVVTSSDAVAHTPCYLDDDGVYAPTLTSTSNIGAFAVFGLPAGPGLVTVTVYDASGESISEIYDIWVPEAGVVGLYPAISPEG